MTLLFPIDLNSHQFWMIIGIFILNILTFTVFLRKLTWILKHTPKAYITKSILLCAPYFVSINKKSIYILNNKMLSSYGGFELGESNYKLP